MAYFSRLKAGVKCHQGSRFNVRQLLLICDQYISRHASFLSVGADRIISALHLTGVKVSVWSGLCFQQGQKDISIARANGLATEKLYFIGSLVLSPCEMNPPHFGALTATRSSEARLPLSACPGIFGGAGSMACRKDQSSKRQESLFMGASLRRSGRS